MTEISEAAPSLLLQVSALHRLSPLLPLCDFWGSFYSPGLHSGPFLGKAFLTASSTRVSIYLSQLLPFSIRPQAILNCWASGGLLLWRAISEGSWAAWGSDKSGAGERPRERGAKPGDLTGRLPALPAGGQCILARPSHFRKLRADPNLRSLKRPTPTGTKYCDFPP